MNTNNKRKKDEKGTKESEKKYRMLFKNMAQGAFYQQADGALIDVNPAALKLFGLSRSQFLKRTSYSPQWQVIREDGSRCLAEEHPSMIALKTGKPARNVTLGVYNPLRKDYIWMNINAIPLFRSGEKKPYQTLVTLHNITERKQTEQKILTSEARYRELFNHMKSGVAVYEAVDNGRDFIFRDFNRAGQRIEKINKKSLIGKSVLQVFPGVKEFGLFDVFQRVWKTGTPEHHPVSFYKDKRIVGWRDNYVYKLPSGEVVAVYDDITQRKQIEETLKESEEKFRLAFENANTGVCLVDLDGNLIKVNHKMCEFFGYTKKELEAMTVNDIAHPEDLDTSPAFIQKTLKGEISRGSFEKRYIHKKGHVVTCEVSSSLVRDNEERPLYFISHVNDITDRKRAEEDLQKSEKKYRDLINGMNDTVWVIDFDTTILDVNNAATKVLGYTRDELLSMKIADIDVNLKPEAIQDLASNMPVDKIQVFETFHKTKGGKKVPVEISSSLVTFDGKTAIMSIARDITKRKQAEEALLNSEHEKSAILNTMSELVVYQDTNHNIIWANQAAAQSVNKNIEDLKGRKCYEIWADKEKECEICPVAKALKTGKMQQEEIATPDGKTWFIKGYPLKNKTEDIIGAIELTLNITERKKAEEAFKKSQETLAKITNSIDDVIYSINGQTGEFEYLSPVFERKFGYSLSDIKRMGGRWPFLSQVVQDENRTELDPVVTILQKKRTRKTPVWKHWWRCKNGSLLYIEDRSVLTYYGNQLVRIDGVLRDITERKRTEEKYGLIIKRALDGFWINDSKGRFLEVNESYCSMTGYTREELLTMSIPDIEALETLKDVNQRIKKVIDKGYDRFETRHRRKYGKIIDVEISINYVPKEKHYFVFVRDITERKQAEETISKERMLLRTLIDNLPCAVFVKDKEYRKIIVNPIHINRVRGHLKYLGMNADIDILGKTDFEVFPKELAERFFADDQKVILNGKTIINHEEIGATPEGEKIWLLVSKVPLYDKGGSIVGMVGITTDITDRKLAEEQIQNDLREKEILIRELYHRTKNNMQVISSMLRLEARHIKNEEVTASFKEIENKILTMALVHQKLYESKDLSRLNLKEYINDLISLIKNSQLSSPDQVTFKMKGEAINVLIDTAIPIGLVINELITNALKYAFPDNRKGEIKINLFLTKKRELVIELSDNGVGLPKEFNIKKDTHLGLGMVIDLVKHQLQGKIDYQSKEGLSWHILLKEEVYKPRV